MEIDYKIKRNEISNENNTQTSIEQALIEFKGVVEQLKTEINELKQELKHKDKLIDQLLHENELLKLKDSSEEEDVDQIETEQKETVNNNNNKINNNNNNKNKRIRKKNTRITMPDSSRKKKTGSSGRKTTGNNNKQ